MSLTKAAFDEFRSTHQKKNLDPAKVSNQDQISQMNAEDGLEHWVDGQATDFSEEIPSETPIIQDAQLEKQKLWAVRDDDVAVAFEVSDFANLLQDKKIKHSNLTGGQPAYSGGELLLLDVDTIVVNGMSGRYGPKSANELGAVVRAFRRSGYRVWSMGWDAEANRPAPFIGVAPEWVLS